MDFPFSVLQIGAHSEKLMYVAIDCEAACRMATIRNNKLGGLIFIVVKPDGSRMCISDQRKFLENNRRCLKS